jgi:hypothetical protein
MLKLNRPKESRWVDLGRGVRVLRKPMTPAMLAAAQSAAKAEVLRIKAGRDGLLMHGAEVFGLDLDDPHVAAGLAQDVMTRALAKYLITDWQGVAADNGAPLPFDAAKLPDLMAHEDLANTFFADCLTPQLALAAEGNGFGPSPSGTSAAGPDTADAATPTPPAATTAAAPMTGTPH